jgi:glycosyltransferase involved in cell wall biosynthesis/ribosomal protein S18 acetylase RimI-like enzyme
MTWKVAHLTTVDLSLRYLVLPQLLAVREQEGDALGISAPGPFVAEIEAMGIRHLPLATSTRGMHPLRDLRAAWDLWRILRRERPDVLHTHNPKPGLYGRVVGRLAGVPIVVNTVHGLYATPEDRVAKRGLVYLLEAIAARCSHAELVQSAEDFELLTRWRISPRSRSFLLGNGVDLERFSPEAVPAVRREALRRELGIDPTQVAVGMVGRLVVEKGWLELFAAATELDDRYVILAIGPEDPEKSDAIPEAELTSARQAGVRFLGMRKDVVDLYGAMDLFVLPSHREGFPRAAMEAAAMGLPVVATDIRGCREVVEDGVNGLVVPVREPGTLASAIRKLGDDPALRERMGRAGRQRAEERFDESKVVEKVLRTYEWARRAQARDGTVKPNSDWAARPAAPVDVPAIARLHVESISAGFLPRLGTRFLRQIYRALLEFPGSVVYVADDGVGPIGFVAGVTDTGEFYRFFARRHAARAALAAVPRLLRPSNLRRAWETWHYEGGEIDVPAELLAMAVVGDARGRGIGTELGRRFLDELQARGVDQVKVVVGHTNRRAVGAYRRMGFEEVGTIEVHTGERSTLLVWSV